MGFPGGSDSKESACSLPAGDPGSIPELGRSPGEGNGYPLQYSCLENPMDRGAWRAAIHGVAESDRTERFTQQRSTRETRQVVSRFTEKVHVAGQSCFSLTSLRGGFQKPWEPRVPGPRQRAASHGIWPTRHRDHEDHPTWRALSWDPNPNTCSLSDREANHSPRRAHVLPQVTQAARDPPATQVRWPQRRRASL